MIKQPSREKRHMTRSPARYFVHCNLFFPEKRKLGLEEFEATTADLSEEGVALIADHDIDVGAHLIVKFSVNNEMGNTLSSFRKVIVFTGTLVYSKKVGPRAYRLGISFHPGETADNEDKYYDIICSPSYCWPIGGWEEEVPQSSEFHHN